MHMNNEQQFSRHINDTVHMTNIATNGRFLQIDGENMRCTLCDTGYFGIVSSQSHFLGKSHTKNLQQLCLAEEFDLNHPCMVQQGVHYECAFCTHFNVHMNDEQQLRLHINGTVHITNVAANGRFLQVDGEHVICTLCDTGYISITASKSHFSGRTHTMKLQQLEDEERMSRRVKLMKNMENGVAPLGLQRWRCHMKSLFYDFIMIGDEELGKTIHVKLGHYYAKEITSLLELAIWKQSILRAFFDEMQEVHDYAVLDGQFNRPQYLHEAMITSGASIIIPRVYDFLIDRNDPEKKYRNFFPFY